MRHRVAGRHLNRTAAHRKALRRNLAASLLEHGAIRTTRAKASEVRPFVERLITLARKGTLHARRQVISLLGDRHMADEEDPGELAEQTVVQKLFDEIAPRYADRPGGYTRIIHLPERRIGDAGRQVLLQLVEETPAEPAGASPAGSRRRRAARRAEAAKAVIGDQVEAPDGPEARNEDADQPQDEDDGTSREDSEDEK
jgi:large subunit ribosomal protein L17